MIKIAPHGSEFTSEASSFCLLVPNLFLVAQYFLIIEECIDLNQVIFRYFSHDCNNTVLA